MDRRQALARGTQLAFPGMTCIIEGEIGRGSNGVVYEGWYSDRLTAHLRHRVLVKELFPYAPEGGIERGADGSVCVEASARDTWDVHALSFRRGNEAHLALLARSPERIGANLNTFELNGTYYTVLGYTGGRSLQQALGGGSLKDHVRRTLGMLDALSAFHGAGCVHLDVSPDNVLLIGENGHEQVMLIDFNSVHDMEELRRGGAVYYSAKEGYTPPEVRTGATAEIGMTSDLFSVTAVFYRLIAGVPLTAMQMLRKSPPDVDGCPCMQDASAPVKTMVRQILRRGLAAVTRRRYQTIAEMHADLRELIDRIEGVGVTHWALWESGRHTVSKLIRQNASLAYLRGREEMYPLRCGDFSGSVPVQDALANIMGGAPSALLTAPGGMGKTTALLDAVERQSAQYAPGAAAVMYVPLYDYRFERDGGHYIIDKLLSGLHFRADTATYADARQALTALLDRPLTVRGEDKPTAVLLLDGLNEAEGDLSALMHEITLLAAKPGVRVIITSRTAHSELPLRQMTLLPLSDADVTAELGAKGLLLPESEEMRQLLRTPMMLSMFIRTAQAEETQLQPDSSDELLGAYLSALEEKETAALDDQSPEKWQIAAAIGLVLPALAACEKKDAASLLAATEKCWKLLHARRARKMYPAWTGHMQDIFGGAKDAEAWYGLMVHTLLWQRLGLLIRDDAKQYRVCHQIMEEYLRRLWHTGVGRAEKRRVRLRIGAGVLAVLLAVAGWGVWKAYFDLKPYPQVQAEMVMDQAVARYSAINDLRERLWRLAASVYTDDENRYILGEATWLDHYLVTSAGMLGTISLTTARMMVNSGDVMPWSRLPFDMEQFSVFVNDVEARCTRYNDYAQTLMFVHGVRAGESFRTRYPEQLMALLEVDQQIYDCLLRIICQPHLEGLEAEDKVLYDETMKAMGEYAHQETHFVTRTLQEEKALLASLMQQRTDIENEISASGVMVLQERNRNGK